MIINKISVAIAPPWQAKFFNLVSKEITRSAFEALIYHLRLSLDTKTPSRTLVFWEKTQGAPLHYSEIA